MKKKNLNDNGQLKAHKSQEFFFKNIYSSYLIDKKQNFEFRVDTAPQQN